MFSAQIPVASLRKRAKKHNKIRMNFAKPYADLREFIAALDANNKLYRIHREINKDTELQPLVRWQFRGGIPEHARRGFLFDNVTDGKKRKYNCQVLVGGLSGSEAIYCLGIKCRPEEVADRWIYAMDHLIDPMMVDYGSCQEEIHKGDQLLALVNFFLTRAGIDRHWIDQMIHRVNPTIRDFVRPAL